MTYVSSFFCSRGGAGPVFFFIGSKAAPETAISSHVSIVKMDAPEHPLLSLSDAPKQQPLIHIYKLFFAYWSYTVLIILNVHNSVCMKTSTTVHQGLIVQYTQAFGCWIHRPLGAQYTGLWLPNTLASEWSIHMPLTPNIHAYGCPIHRPLTVQYTGLWLPNTQASGCPIYRPLVVPIYRPIAAQFTGLWLPN